MAHDIYQFMDKDLAYATYLVEDCKRGAKNLCYPFRIVDGVYISDEKNIKSALNLLLPQTLAYICQETWWFSQPQGWYDAIHYLTALDTVFVCSILKVMISGPIIVRETERKADPGAAAGILAKMPEQKSKEILSMLMIDDVVTVLEHASSDEIHDVYKSITYPMSSRILLHLSKTKTRELLDDMDDEEQSQTLNDIYSEFMVRQGPL